MQALPHSWSAGPHRADPPRPAANRHPRPDLPYIRAPGTTAGVGQLSPAMNLVSSPRPDLERDEDGRGLRGWLGCPLAGCPLPHSGEIGRREVRGLRVLRGCPCRGCPFPRLDHNAPRPAARDAGPIGPFHESGLEGPLNEVVEHPAAVKDTMRGATTVAHIGVGSKLGTSCVVSWVSSCSRSWSPGWSPLTRTQLGTTPKDGP
jgi:hypothetical protein